MTGARKYAIPIFSTYEQLGLEKLYDKSVHGCIYYGNHTVFEFDQHARGRTLNIYIIKNEDVLRDNGLYYCDSLKVYGMVSGQCGWDEKYGWIVEGIWCKYINNILETSLFLYEQNKEKAEAEERQRKIEKREKIENRAKEFEKFFQ